MFSFSSRKIALVVALPLILAMQALTVLSGNEGDFAESSPTPEEMTDDGTMGDPAYVGSPTGPGDESTHSDPVDSGSPVDLMNMMPCDDDALMAESQSLDRFIGELEKEWAARKDLRAHLYAEADYGQARKILDAFWDRRNTFPEDSVDYAFMDEAADRVWKPYDKVYDTIPHVNDFYNSLVISRAHLDVLDVAIGDCRIDDAMAILAAIHVDLVKFSSDERRVMGEALNAASGFMNEANAAAMAICAEYPNVYQGDPKF